MAPPGQLRRDEQLAQLSTRRFDLVVVGGGISGAWVALDAASRGLDVALLEKDDFASGTSSKSSKMIHGGLRYIEQRNIDLVRHSLHERQRLQANAPHLVQRLPFLFPVLSEEGVFDRRMARAFEALLWTYDALGGWRIGRLHQKLSAAEVLSHCPTLRSEHLVGGFMYYDARADDARLTVAVVRTAAAFGAVVLNGAEVLAVHDAPGRRDVEVELRSGEDVLRVGAGAVVAAGGVWNERIAGSLAAGRPRRIRPAKGVHVFLPWRLLRNDCSVTVVVPGRARRGTVTRWGDTVYLGTTDTDYEGPLDEVHCTREELELLLGGINRAFDVSIGAEDVVGSCAGLRPLIGERDGTTSELSRNHEISRHGRIFSLTGGKLTTGRYMGEQTVDAVTRFLGRSAPCRTARLGLV
ncbi:MAG TPA: glycerol-3-phosphate dehydrogenase/oxidase, partial [Acidimicrobiales bacterium]|nr:glycerol-3-phosphate dehydrogenase/oxidase [Acidimicrobiales bacterium]